MISNVKSLYPYKGVPLTPAIIEDLIKQLFTGRLVGRQTIVDEVVRHHENYGGLKADVQDITSSVKRALSNLKERKLAENPSTGYWKIGELSIMDNSISDIVEQHDEIIKTTQPIADKEIGNGSSAVYLYYLPMYRHTAEQNNEASWFCKIGKTDRDPLQRILTQASTALPEKPHIALIIRTDLPTQLESAIHSILTLRGKKIDSSPGSEWFLTSPVEVETIFLNIIEGNNVR